MKKLIDPVYRYIRPFRPLYGWAKDAALRQRSKKRAQQTTTKGLHGAKLDICGGRNPYKPGEYLNVDIVAFPQVDLTFDITERFPIDDNMIAEIFSAATVEHLRKHDVDHVLQEFFRVLQPGGFVRIIQPDLEAIAKSVIEGHDLAEINQFLFGKFKSKETDLYDLHKWMYPAAALMNALEQIGFVNAKREPIDDELHALQCREFNFLVRADKPAP